MKSYYYQDERLTIIEHDGLFDVLDKKCKGRIKCRNVSKSMADALIQSVLHGREIREIRLKAKAERG